MPNQVATSQVIRFATFEVDLQAQELRKAGLRLKLSGQPFQVLAILLEQPGTVVTREELQKRLWPDSFVDFDHNINTAINKIREVLGDSSENPRFVETLSKRGYRFICPITLPASPTAGENGNCTRTKAKPLPETFRLTTVAALAGTVLLLGTSTSAWWFYSRPRHPLTDKDTIVLADFTNTTGDAVFDGALRQGLSAQLEQSPVLSIIPDDHIQETLQRMRQKPDVKLTPEISREVCQR